MSIAVQFPDGSVRDIPGQLRQVDDDSFPNHPPRFEQVPLNCDSRWLYYRSGKSWFARPRHGHLAAFRPAVDEWWHSIEAMADSEEAKPGRWESAA
ncbi:hypothetical protein [Sphingobium sp.]|uniref:hypothetical protein n=1 Tax=Sphingobium sp. TaxID=1912891 RepID=UPI002B99C9B2|nr:hypothetical protein [Sphingobium sp.]HUD92008.1 hypothetical protein [Sphingobium sp.]